MKRISILLAVSLAFATPAAANVYVAVDANGVAVGGAIMCDAGTCGPGSSFSLATLKPGERYVLQGTGQAGIGNNNPGTEVKVNIETNEWTVTRQTEVKLVEPLVINQQQVVSYTVQTVEKFTPATSPGNDRPTQVVQVSVQETSTAVVETKTATVDSSTVKVDTSTATVQVTEQITVVELQSMVRNLLTRLWALIRELKK